MLTAAIGHVQSLDQEKEFKEPDGAAHRGSQSFICAPTPALGHSRRFRPASKKSALPLKADLTADMPEVG
jgi:hypothetical protein